MNESIFFRLNTATGSRPSTSSRPSTASINNPRGFVERDMGTNSLLRIMNIEMDKLKSDLLSFAEKGDCNGIRRVLSEGIELFEARGLAGYAPLHHAASRGHAEACSVLLRASHAQGNCCVNVTNDLEETPLHLATYMGHLLIVEQLLDCGADVNAKNRYNETALFYAARKNMPALVRLLLQRGADPSIVDDNDEKAIDHTEDNRTRAMFETSSLLQNTSVEIDRGCSASMMISHLILQHIFLYLHSKDICRCACVAGKWHRASESEEIWKGSRLRKWEYALQGSLGFAPLATASFRPKNSIKKSRDKIIVPLK